MNIKNFTLLFLICFTANIFAQDIDEKGIIIYKTYKDFENDKGKEYKGDFKVASKTHSFKSKYITLKNRDKNASADSKKIKVHCDKIWGYVFNGYLFRVHPKTNTPYCVIRSGKYIFYENGILMMKIATISSDDNKSYAVSVDTSWDGVFYLSESMNSEMYDASSKAIFKRSVKKANAFEGFYDCIADTKRKEYEDQMRTCAEMYLTN